MGQFAPSARVGNSLVARPSLGPGPGQADLSGTMQGALYYARKRRRKRANAGVNQFSYNIHRATPQMGFAMAVTLKVI